VTQGISSPPHSSATSWFPHSAQHCSPLWFDILPTNALLVHSGFEQRMTTTAQVVPVVITQPPHSPHSLAPCGTSIAAQGLLDREICIVIGLPRYFAMLENSHSFCHLALACLSTQKEPIIKTQGFSYLHEQLSISHL
jgi:hypothetical protein